MTKKNNSDIVDLMTHFQKSILDNKPNFHQMFDEIRMMQFKIKPLNGDISLLNLKNQDFIGILWSLGKLDEFFQMQYQKVSSKKKDLFLRLFDEIHEKFQEQLDTLSLKPEKIEETSPTFEMEIFKERSTKFN